MCTVSPDEQRHFFFLQGSRFSNNLVNLSLRNNEIIITIDRYRWVSTAGFIYRLIIKCIRGIGLLNKTHTLFAPGNLTVQPWLVVVRLYIGTVNAH